VPPRGPSLKPMTDHILRFDGLGSHKMRLEESKTPRPQNISLLPYSEDSPAFWVASPRLQISLFWLFVSFDHPLKGGSNSFLP